jgi:hypothetical protein
MRAAFVRCKGRAHTGPMTFGRYRIALVAIAARVCSGEINTATLRDPCDEAVLRSAFQRIGGPGRIRFERNADQSTGLLGRAHARAGAARCLVPAFTFSPQLRNAAYRANPSPARALSKSPQAQKSVFIAMNQYARGFGAQNR